MKPTDIWKGRGAKCRVAELTLSCSTTRCPLDSLCIASPPFKNGLDGPDILGLIFCSSVMGESRESSPEEGELVEEGEILEEPKEPIQASES